MKPCRCIGSSPEVRIRLRISIFDGKVRLVEMNKPASIGQRKLRVRKVSILS